MLLFDTCIELIVQYLFLKHTLISSLNMIQVSEIRVHRSVNSSLQSIISKLQRLNTEVWIKIVFILIGIGSVSKIDKSGIVYIFLTLCTWRTPSYLCPPRNWENVFWLLHSMYILIGMWLFRVFYILCLSDIKNCLEVSCSFSLSYRISVFVLFFVFC